MKKVLFVLHDDYSRSGATASMLTVIKYLNKNKKMDIDVLVPDFGGDVKDILNESDISTISHKYYGSRFYFNTKKIKLINLILKTLIKNFYNLFSLLLLFKKNKKKYDLIYSNTSDNYFGFLYSLINRTDHIWHMREFGWEDQRAIHFVGDKIFYRMAELKSNKIVVISKALESKVLRFVNDEQKISVIYNDIDGKNIKYYGREKKGAINILIAGTISVTKGQEFVINQMSILEKEGISFKVIFAGKGDFNYIEELKKKVHTIGLSQHIKFAGHVHDLEEIRKEMDICIVPSVSEAFGRVTIEAMLSGMVVVAYNGGANSELINHGVTGFLYNNDKEFCEILKNLHNGVSLLDVRQNAYSFAIKFTNNIAADKIERLILGL